MLPQSWMMLPRRWVMLTQRWVMFRRRAFTHHHVGDSRLAPVFGWQFVLPSGLESNCQPTTGASWLSPTQPWMKILRRKVAHLKRKVDTCLREELKKRSNTLRKVE
ncbi:MAG: hypothetical protein LBI18_06055 [Planctomycetaceae bacterium]|nr:hypothetical protein [Planctomycetaceae bacterium]